MSALRDLTAHFSSVGRVEAIYLRPQRGQAVDSVEHATAEPGRGLLGDRHASRQRESDQARRREITLLQAEHLALLAAWTGNKEFDAQVLRRNLVISGLNLLSLRSPFADRPVYCKIGDQVIIQITGPCDPCSQMEAALGVGAYNAMRGHGGVTARIVQGGQIKVGASLVPGSACL